MKKDYKGYTIEVRDQHNSIQFWVDGPNLESRRQWTESYAEATKLVDDVTRATVIATKEKIALPVYNALGEEKLITGIHGGHGGLLGVGTDHHYCYPRVKWIGELLRRRFEIAKEMATIDRNVEEYRIATKRSYGAIEADRIQPAIKKVKDEVAEKTNKAKSEIRPTTEA